MARAIHRASPRSREAFVQVNCAAIPDDLIESELFGHEKGSFTGATQKQIGKFEQADRGTIFLDEVGDMSLKTQARCCACCRRVRSSGSAPRAPSRWTCGCWPPRTRTWPGRSTPAEFREDLFFRLSVIPIGVPPLRERPEDVPPLVQHFAALFARENNFRPKAFAADALDALGGQHWRGNVRELRNSVERLIVMTPGEEIGGSDVRAVLGSGARPAGAAADQTGRTLREFKETSERAFLVRKLREFEWNISKTAEEIDTPRSNLYKKLEQYNIRQEADG